MGVAMLVLMVVLAVARSAAALAVHPCRLALDVVFFFPDRQALLQLVDDVATGLERLVAMRRGRAHPDGKLAHRKVADTVHAREAHRAEAGLCLLEDLESLIHRQVGVCLVVQARDSTALVMVANPAFERRVSPAARAHQFAAQRLYFNGILADGE